MSGLAELTAALKTATTAATAATAAIATATGQPPPPGKIYKFCFEIKIIIPQCNFGLNSLFLQSSLRKSWNFKQSLYDRKVVKVILSSM